MTKLPTLNILSVEALEIEKQLLETGELTPELELRLDENKQQIAVKLDHYNYAYENMNDKKERLSLMKKRIDQELKTLDKNQQFIINRLEMFHKEFGDLKGENGEWVYKKSKSVKIIDIDKLPVGCIRVKTEPDKKAIKELLESGPVDGAEIETNLKLVYKPKI